MKRPSKLYIYGKHAVAEALRHTPRAVRTVYLAASGDEVVRSLAQKANIPIEKLDERKVTSMVEGKAPHQGVVALISQSDLVVPAERFIEHLQVTDATLVVFLSEITDPHNVGAIIRSAAALGAAAVMLPTHKQSPVTPAVIKVSAGMAFQIPLVAAENPQQAIAQLKKKGVHVYGLAADAQKSLKDETFAGPMMIVVGNEGEGIAPYARALCDTMLSIDLEPTAESLNVAASTAIALYAWRRTRSL